VDRAEDVAAVIAVQNAYAVAIDRRDWPALRTCFADDATIRFGVPLRDGTLDEFVVWAPEFHDALGPTLHQVSTHQVDLHGTTATATAYLHAVLVDADRASAQSIFGRYDDEFVRGPGGWVIRHRRFQAVWRTPGTAVPPVTTGAQT
jgi:ketosteroid isomerase-like protein